MSGWLVELRTLHVACALVSVGLFILRHFLNLRGQAWRRSRALRIAPHAVDGLLLLSAVALCVASGQYPLAQSWLTVKLIGLVGYVVLAIQTLRPGRSLLVRRIAFFGAIAAFGFVYSVARTHSPLGVFAQL